MSGFFSSNDQSSYGTAAADYDREYGSDPAAFDKGALGRLFDRLFSGTPKSGKITSSALPDISPTSPAAPTASPAPPQKAAGSPAISSGQGLLDRILKAAGGPPTHTAQGDPLVPGTAMTTPQFMQAITQEFQKSLQAQPLNIPGMGQTGDAARMSMPQPPALAAPRAPWDAHPGASPYGNQTFGGNTFGGGTFGGNRFGASAGAPPMPAAPASVVPPIQAAGFFSGGPIHMMRGGYPQHLLGPGGMPTRFASGDYVQPDGKGDGRSDHVPARLSPGEYVMDAETVSMLGNGDNEAGARKLDGMRHNLRVQKGTALAKGKFSPDAKTPEAYLRGQR